MARVVGEDRCPTKGTIQTEIEGEGMTSVRMDIGDVCSPSRICLRSGQIILVTGDHSNFGTLIHQEQSVYYRVLDI